MNENEPKDYTTTDAGTDEGRPISNRLLVLAEFMELATMLAEIPCINSVRVRGVCLVCKAKELLKTNAVMSRRPQD